MTPHRFLFVFFMLKILAGFAQTADKADTSSSFIVKDILITGNKITHDHIILRELSFKKNDTIHLSKEKEIFRKSKENLLNTSLFNFITIDTIHANAGVSDIMINVIERWYFWPLPFFDISERNFNTWWDTKDLSKAAYGLFLTDENFRGRKESLRLLIRMGYDEQYGISYKIPYLNKGKTLGSGFVIGYGQNHEVGYATENNKPVFYKDKEHYIQKDIFSTLQFVWRKGIYNMHTFQVNFDQYLFSDTLEKINKDFSSRSDTLNRFLSFYYQFKSDHRDNIAYPLHGYYYSVEVVKRGFGIMKNENLDMLYLTLNFRKFFQLGDRFFFASSIKTKISNQSFQPYFIQKALGYGSDFVRGYEYYVIDGQDYALLKTNFKFTILPEKVSKFNFIPTEKFNTIHYAIYLNFYADAAYVSDIQESRKMNNMTNSYLYGTGLGLDFVTYYDKVFRFEYSVNAQGEGGIFIHFVSPI